MPTAIPRKYVLELLKYHQTLRKTIHANMDQDASEIDQWKADRIALRVELGEFCNEWQGFKYWKKHRDPVRERLLPGTYQGDDGKYHQYTSDPMLEEYVDMLLFILVIGNEMDIADANPEVIPAVFTPAYNYPHKDMLDVIERAYKIYGEIWDPESWVKALEVCLAIGDRVGFEPIEITNALVEKVKKNKQRQDSGY